MKKFLLIFALFTFVSLTMTAQPQLTWRFANFEVINAGTQLQFDVEVMANASGSYHRDLQIYFDYNTLAFGSNLVASGNITYSPLTLMNVSKYTVVNMADNTSSKFAIITEALQEMVQPGSATYYSEITTSYQGLLRFTVDIVSNTQTTGIAFDQTLMNGGQYYQSLVNTNPLKYIDPSLYDNNGLTSLKLSSIYGNVKYANVAQTVMNNCPATLYSGATPVDTYTTDATGTYYFTGMNDGSYTIQTTSSKPHGGVTTADGILVARFAAGVGTFTPIQIKAADVNQSGSITTVDGILVKRKAAGYTSPAWTAPNYVFEVPTVTVASGLGTANYKSLCSGDVNGSYTPPAN